MSIQPTFAQTQQILVNKFWNVLNANPVSGVEWSASIIDPFGNLITAGNTVDANFQVNLLLVKQSPSGQTLWQQEFSAGTNTKKRSARDKTRTSKALFLELDEARDHIIVTGDEAGDSGNSYLKTIRYDEDGKILWESIHDGDATAPEKTTGLLTDGDGVVTVTAVIEQSPSSQEYEVVTYKPYFYDVGYDYDVDSVPVNADKEVLIRFSPALLDTGFIDNEGLIYGAVKDVVIDTGLINDMDQVLGANGRLEDWKLVKISPFLSTSDIEITDRYGKTMPIPPFWATFQFLLETDMDEVEASDSLMTLGPKPVWWAHPNYFVSLDAPPPPPNDPLWGTEQGALNSLIGTEGHINIEAAWDAGATGNENIRVGIFDSGVSYTHPDFGTTFGGLNGSVITDGFDFTTGADPIDLEVENDFNWGHGTRITGMIGAVRNNGIGVAGIAGGDINGTGERGAALYAFKWVLSNGNFGSNLASAMTYALTQGGSGGDLAPLVDITNHSYGSAPPQGGFQTFDETYYNHFKAGMIAVASRGNEGDASFQSPGALNDRLVISVGGSGMNGELRTVANGDQDLQNGEDDVNSSYGLTMDFIAPATKGLILTTNNLDPDPEWTVTCAPDMTNDLEYTCFNSSSSATAHATGVAALIAGFHEFNENQNLVPLFKEDVERLLEYGALDKGQPFYDAFSGWGLLDAGESIDLIDKNNGGRKIFHAKIIPDLSPPLACTGAGACNLVLSSNYYSPYSALDDQTFPGETSMLVTPFEYKATININVCELTSYNGKILELDDPDPAKVAAWIVNSRSNLWQVPGGGPVNFTSEPVDRVSWESGPFIDDCSVSGTLVGFAYEVMEIGDVVISSEMIPNNNEEYQMWLSILVEDPTNELEDGSEISIITSNEIKQDSYFENKITVYPNPTNDRLNISYNLENSSSVALGLYSLDGQQLKEFDKVSKASGTHQQELDISSFSGGVYYIRLQSDEGVGTIKIIKI